MLKILKLNELNGVRLPLIRSLTLWCIRRSASGARVTRNVRRLHG